MENIKFTGRDMDRTINDIRSANLESCQKWCMDSWEEWTSTNASDILSGWRNICEMQDSTLYEVMGLINSLDKNIAEVKQRAGVPEDVRFCYGNYDLFRLCGACMGAPAQTHLVLTEENIETADGPYRYLMYITFVPSADSAHNVVIMLTLYRIDREGHAEQFECPSDTWGEIDPYMMDLADPKNDSAEHEFLSVYAEAIDWPMTAVDKGLIKNYFSDQWLLLGLYDRVKDIADLKCCVCQDARTGKDTSCMFLGPKDPNRRGAVVLQCGDDALRLCLDMTKSDLSIMSYGSKRDFDVHKAQERWSEDLLGRLERAQYVCDVWETASIDEMAETIRYMWDHPTGFDPVFTFPLSKFSHVNIMPPYTKDNVKFSGDPESMTSNEQAMSVQISKVLGMPLGDIDESRWDEENDAEDDG